MSNRVTTWEYTLKFSFKTKKYINVQGDEIIKYDSNSEQIVEDLKFYLNRIAVGEWDLDADLLKLSNLDDCYKVKMMFDLYIIEFIKTKKA